MTDELDFDPFAGGELAGTAPTTDPQQEIWLAVKLGGDLANLAYNESIVLDLQGTIDAGALAAVLRALVMRHDALRSTFTDDGETFCVEATGRVELGIDDLRGLNPEERNQRRLELRRAEVTTPFDLTHDPLFRARLVTLSNQEHELILTGHHLVCDGWSAWVIVTELRELYAAHLAGREPALEPAPQFADYAVQQREAAYSEDAAAAERYWLKTLGDQPPVLDLPADRPRPLERDPSAAREDWKLDPTLLEGLHATSRRLGMSLVSVLLAAFDAFLYRLTGQTDFVIAMPAAGQAASDLPALVGHCVNTLPLRLTLDPEAPFVEHVRTVRRAILDGFENQQLSFGSLIKKLNLPRDPSRVPLTPIIFNVDRSFELTEFGPASVVMETNPRVADNFELFINGAESEDGLVLETTYNTSLFDRETVCRWLAELRVVLEAVVADPEQPLGALPVLPEDERRRQIEEWNQTEVELPTATTVLELVEEQVAKTPDAVAVRDERTALTYRELDRQANHLAHHLIELGVEPDTCVGVCVERTARMVVALLAVWKAGAAYVPLDPEYPVARLEFVARDAELKVLLTERSVGGVLDALDLKRAFLEEHVGETEQAPPRTADPKRLAYVLHTSGSTGQPKGVQIEHRSFVNLLHSMRQWPSLDPSDVLVAVTTLSFDMAEVELFLPLVVGAQVVVATREVAMDARALGELVTASGGTVVQATPVTWRMLVEADWRGHGVKAFTGGEPLAPDLATEMLARVREVYNLYGPTETTVYSTGIQIESAEGITIGRPLGNTTAYILDERLQLLPTGARGELYLGGLGLARGYLNRPDLTEERFVPNPFQPGAEARLYRTGDVARYDNAGRIVYEGRNDAQVKLRGFRIELGEIEHCLAQQPSVRQCATVLKEVGPGDLRLVAYVTSETGSVEAAPLQDALRKRLPPYMVPQHIVQLEAFPLTPNGKVDRKALPLPELGAAAADAYVEPRTATERQLAAIWGELLRVTRVGVHDGFFELGGHSMLAVRMMNRIRESFGVELPLRTIFQAQTIEAVALRVDAALLQQPAAGPTGTGVVEEVEF